MTRTYLPIEDYGLIGNLQTTAHVSRTDASVDFFCFPSCDSPTVFARLLDCRRGGYFEICPVEAEYGHKQLYFPSSNVLQTRFSLLQGIGQVTDLLPITQSSGEELFNPSWLIRRVEVVRGTVQFRITCQPAFDYGRLSHSVQVMQDKIIFSSQHKCLELISCHDRLDSGELCWTVDESSCFEHWSTGKVVQPKASALISMREGSSLILVLRQRSSEPLPSFSDLQDMIRDTNLYWHDWISKATYRGRWREMVQRSALVLKLLTHRQTGAIIAAPTFSLPEEFGGCKNWDYRFTWIRDAAFTVYAFMRIGLTEETALFMDWIEARCRDMKEDSQQNLRILYDVNGGHPVFAVDHFLEETSKAGPAQDRSVVEVQLDHWEGYMHSGPVRIGNAAATQSQLDIYGELMDAVYLCDKYCRPVGSDFWRVIKKRLVEPVLNHWKDADYGIWEVRGPPRHYVYSKVMCWVCLDRAIRLAVKHSLPAPLEEWRLARDSIYAVVMEYGWNEPIGAFVQHLNGSTAMDAANLVMPLVFFIAPSDPKFIGTLERIKRSMSEGGLCLNHLVFRYHISELDPDAEMIGDEGTFNMCTFWLTEALALAGRYDRRYLNEALVLFEDMIGYANHLGLFSEEIDLRGRASGNFPQALSHLALISAAFNLDRVLG